MRIEPHKIYCTFMQIFDDGHIFYGWGKISSAYEPKPCNRSLPFNVFVEDTFETFEEARLARQSTLPGKPEPAGTQPLDAIRCVETQAVFRTRAAAARATRTDAPRMSQHLRRAPGFKTIRGLTFEVLKYYTGGFSEDLEMMHSVVVDAYISEREIQSSDREKFLRENSIAAMTDGEKEALRSHMRLNGFTPRF